MAIVPDTLTVTGLRWERWTRAAACIRRRVARYTQLDQTDFVEMGEVGQDTGLRRGGELLLDLLLSDPIGSGGLAEEASATALHNSQYFVEYSTVRARMTAKRTAQNG